MKLASLKNIFPSISNAGLAFVSAVLLILAFPDFEFSILAWFALIPLFFAIEREKEFWKKSFVTGWIFGTVFFFGTCYWLTFAPITYAGFPAAIAYFLMFGVSLIVGLFPAIFGAFFSILLKRFGSYAILSAPFLWVFTEFLRYWLTGNNWNAIGYSQAFYLTESIIQSITVSGISLAGFHILVWNTLFFALAYFYLSGKKLNSIKGYIIYISLFAYIFPLFGIVTLIFDNKLSKLNRRKRLWAKVRFQVLVPLFFFFFLSISIFFLSSINNKSDKNFIRNNPTAFVIAVQPNVPMSGLTYEKYEQLLERHVQLAENAYIENLPKIIEEKAKLSGGKEEDKPFWTEQIKKQFQEKPKIIIFPESPMIFQYGRDRDLQKFLKDFAVRNNVSVLFNSAENTIDGNRILNSAVMINERGEKTAQYDKIHLLPFGEFIPFPEPLASQMPAFVGNFEFGNEYDLLEFGEARGGVMICFESHFGELSREYAKLGADVLIEMTNDGYLGNTPVLRQHLANSVFRAVETNRPLLRVTNVGITAYINERGEVSDAAEVYKEATRVWTISKSDGNQTIYVKYGDWFAWLCSLVSLILIFYSFWNRKKVKE